MGFRVIIQKILFTLASFVPERLQNERQTNNHNPACAPLSGSSGSGRRCGRAVGSPCIDYIVRASLFLIGGLVLFTYGYVVNAPQWDFGRLLGVYVVFFFIVAQFISWLVFDQQPAGVVIVGGGFIVAGGIILSYNP